MNELERYLSSEAAQGLFLEEGGFHLHPEDALKKLSLFALPEPGMWVLKLLQAAVDIEAPEIRFTFDRRVVKVEFVNTLQWKAGHILSQLLSGQPAQDSALRHLISGIVGAAVGFSETLVWVCGGERVQVHKSGTSRIEGQEHELFYLSVTRPSTLGLHAKAFHSPLRYVLAQTVDEYKSLVDYARVAPIPVFIDKYRLRGSYHDPSKNLPRTHGYDSDKTDGLCVMLAQFPVQGLGRKKIHYPICDAPLSSYETHAQETNLTTLCLEGSVGVDAVVCLHWCKQRRSRLNLVMDGVIVETRKLFDSSALEPLMKVMEFFGSELALDIYFGVDWEQLDLSQFRSREHHFHNEVVACLPELKRVLTHLVANAHKDWDFSKVPPVKSSLPALSMESLAGGIFISLIVPHLVLVGGVLGTYHLVKKGFEIAGVRSQWLESMRRKARENEVREFQKVLQNLLDAIDSVELELREFGPANDA